MISFRLVLQFHAALAGCAELEGGLAVGVGDEDVTEYDDIHANEHVDVLEIVLQDFHVGHEIARRSKHVDEIDIGAGSTADAADASCLIWLEV